MVKKAKITPNRSIEEFLQASSKSTQKKKIIASEIRPKHKTNKYSLFGQGFLSMEKTFKKKTIPEKPLLEFEGGNFTSEVHDYIDISIETDDDEDSRSYVYDNLKIKRL